MAAAEEDQRQPSRLRQRRIGRPPVDSDPWEPAADLYAGFGVRELWVIDAVALTTGVFHNPAPGGYRETRDAGASNRLAPLVAPEAFALMLDELDLG